MFKSIKYVLKDIDNIIKTNQQLRDENKKIKDLLNEYQKIGDVKQCQKYKIFYSLYKDRM